MAEALCSINLATHVACRQNHSRPLLNCRVSGGGRGGGGGMRVVVSMSQSHSSPPYWASINEQIESHLKKAVTVRDPVSVFEPMHHLLFSAPPDTAPALCIAACDLVDGDGGFRRDQAVAAASALHVMHAAAFTHEHLPLSDRPSLIPMPGPIIHHAFGPNIELLTGDGMIPFGLELVARSDDPAQNNSDRILRVIVEITRAMGSQGVVNGQYSELQYIQLDSNGNGSSWHVINETCEKKEGVLHACGAACGAIIGGGSEEEIEKLRKYGLSVGMIRGTLRMMMSSSPEKKEKMSKRVEELKKLALRELEGFDEAKVGAISSFIEANLSGV